MCYHLVSVVSRPSSQRYCWNSPSFQCPSIWPCLGTFICIVSSWISAVPGPHPFSPPPITCPSGRAQQLFGSPGCVFEGGGNPRRSRCDRYGTSRLCLPFIFLWRKIILSQNKKIKDRLASTLERDDIQYLKPKIPFPPPTETQVWWRRGRPKKYLLDRI